MKELLQQALDLLSDAALWSEENERNRLFRAIKTELAKPSHESVASFSNKKYTYSADDNVERIMRLADNWLHTWDVLGDGENQDPISARQEAYRNLKKAVIDLVEKSNLDNSDRNPLSEDEIKQLAIKYGGLNDCFYEGDFSFMEFARAIEKTHGIDTN